MHAQNSGDDFRYVTSHVTWRTTAYLNRVLNPPNQSSNSKSVKQENGKTPGGENQAPAPPHPAVPNPTLHNVHALGVI